MKTKKIDKSYDVLHIRYDDMKTKDKNIDLILPCFKRDKLGESVFISLRDNILSGKLKEGDKLPSQEVLAETFGVSRTVMREALNKLSSLGLVESEQGRGTFVHSIKLSVLLDPFLTALQFERSSIRELLEVRYSIERVIARLAAQRVQSDELENLKKQISIMEGSINKGGIQDFAEADLAFHMALAEISKNDILKRIICTIREMMRLFLEQFNRIEGASERAIHYHKRILKAVENREVDKAEAEMGAHIQDVAETLHKHYDFDFDL